MKYLLIQNNTISWHIFILGRIFAAGGNEEGEQLHAAYTTWMLAADGHIG